MEELITKIREYLTIINKNIPKIDKLYDDLVDFCIAEVINRTQLYLNSENVPTKLERIIAGVVNNGLKKCLKDIETTNEDVSNVDKVVASISDNGQSISYSNEITRYFTTVSDEELFTGFSALLNRYRRIKVVYPRNDEKQNS